MSRHYDDITHHGKRTAKELADFYRRREGQHEVPQIYTLLR